MTTTTKACTFITAVYRSSLEGSNVIITIELQSEDEARRVAMTISNALDTVGLCSIVLTNPDVNRPEGKPN
jgi:hypothetical protein